MIIYIIVSTLINAILFFILFVRSISNDLWYTDKFDIIFKQLKIIYDEIRDIKRRIDK